MVENKTILFICVSVCICQAVIWRIYTSTVSVDISKMDGIISDPRHGLATGANCSTASKEETILLTNSAFSRTQPGGYFKPVNCKVRDTVAVIVPYRDREEHLKTFLDYMHSFLQRQPIQYIIYVVEMAMPTTFNRGLLANIGVLEAANHSLGVSCYIIHDVDLLPADDRNLYTCSDGPRHMSTSNSNYVYRLPYVGYIGGVISFTATSYRRINGFSNLYFGWGGEDDDLRQRIKSAGYAMQRVPEDIGIYTAMSHGADKDNPSNPYKDKLLLDAKRRMKREGLNTVRYRLLKVTKSKSTDERADHNHTVPPSKPSVLNTVSVLDESGWTV